MKYPPIRTVTCKCDVCNEESDFSYDKDTHNYDIVSGMVVCFPCKEEFEYTAHVYGSVVKWESVPETRINYDEREYEPDYDND